MAYCRRAEELFELYQRCANRRQVETICIAQENGLVAKSPVSVTLRAGGKKTQEKIALTPEESELLLSRIKKGQKLLR